MAKKIVARIGLEASVPTLITGELGYDTDKKTFRIGDGTPTPPRLMTTKATGTFDFSTITSAKFPKVEMVSGGTVDGVDISSLNAANGFIARTGDNAFVQRSITNSDGYLEVANPTGAAGDVSIDLSEGFVELLPEPGMLYSVTHDSSLFGQGTSGTPLGVVQATTTQLGGGLVATQTKVNTGTDNEAMITPAALASLSAASAMATALGNVIPVVWETGNDFDDFVGNGTSGSKLQLKYKAIVPLTTTQRDNLPAGWPTVGMTIWNTSNGQLETYNGSAWIVFRNTTYAVYAVQHASDTNSPTVGEVPSPINGDYAVTHNLATGEYAQYTRTGGAWVASNYKAANTSAAGIVELATNGEAQTKSDTTRVLTPSNLAALSASTSFAGLIELATDGEAQSKSSGGLALTPANLAALGGNESFAGLLELATTGEAAAGSDTSRAVTPAGLLAFLNAQLASKLQLYAVNHNTGQVFGVSGTRGFYVIVGLDQPGYTGVSCSCAGHVQQAVQGGGGFTNTFIGAWSGSAGNVTLTAPGEYGPTVYKGVIVSF